MMTGEYEYGDLFADGKDGNSFLPFMSKVVFLAFVMLDSIALMNLMVGLAVNDIQDLVEADNMMSHKIFNDKWLHPRFKSFLYSRRRIPRKIRFSYNKHRLPDSSAGSPAYLKEALIRLQKVSKGPITNGEHGSDNGDTELKLLLKELLFQLRTPYYSSAVGGTISRRSSL
ncbi:Transient receptor potential channel pyrexia [Dufourea novaeangliae]|uniref:Transient receptor potential channel pyrexia n=1 Tax=Dufourea novaeangliae TaxID=178035 RepID=A0A154PES9_DUFNO|nr:Transient receptor potential channel pyrexia [Dufourea novaeangliae]